VLFAVYFAISEAGQQQAARADAVYCANVFLAEAAWLDQRLLQLLQGRPSFGC
jgi:hypothetical protein